MIETSPIPSSNQKKPLWYFPIAILLSLIFFYFAVRSVSWPDFIAALQSCRIEFFIPGVAASLVNFVLRSQRWGILLGDKKKIDAATLFWACGAGYLGNTVLPFRSGEVVRSVALGQKAGISKLYVFATALTERILDAIFLIVLGLFLIPTVGQVPGWLLPAMRGLGILSAGVILFLLMAKRLEKQIIAILHKIPLPEKWRSPSIHMVEQFLAGAASFQDPGKAALFLLMTIGIWVLDGLGMMFTARAFGMEIGLNQALLLLIGLGLSSAIPSAPGYIGVYQFVAVTILAIFAYSQSQALAFILVAQAVGTLLMLVWGTVGLWRLGIQLNTISKENTQ